jgi:hypothetical protein
MSQRDLTVEFGVKKATGETITDWRCPDLEAQIEESAVKINRLRRKYFSRLGLVIEPIPYEGTTCLFHGGRERDIPPAALARTATLFNQQGIAFMVPLAGGLFLPRDFDPTRMDLQVERSILEVLARNSAAYGVQNVVTVLRDELLALIRRDYPELRVSASCIRFLGGKQGIFVGEEEYRRAFQLFDMVVPLSQHTSFAFLSRFSEHAEKIMAFLSIGCANADLYECYDHYYRVDLRQTPSQQLPITVEDKPHHKEFEFIASSLPVCSPTATCRTPNLNAFLSHRPEELRSLVAMGVNHFKIPREHQESCFPMETMDFLALVKAFVGKEGLDELMVG